MTTPAIHQPSPYARAYDRLRTLGINSESTTRLLDLLDPGGVQAVVRLAHITTADNLLTLLPKLSTDDFARLMGLIGYEPFVEALRAEVPAATR